MRIKNLIFSLLFLCVQINNSQELSEITPPSPEAASFGKFTEVPVSLYTGLANVSIPITSFEVGGKSFPVSLSYHGRGVKVNEIPSRVGMGWALNAGGAISRQTRYVADDKATYGYLKSTNSLITKLASGDWFTSQSARTSYLSQGTVTREATDRLPDMFSLQASGVSAKFIMDYKSPHEPILQKYDDLEVTYVLGVDTQDPSAGERIISFQAVDAQGFTYYFGISKDGNRIARNWDQTLGSYNFPMVGSYGATPASDFYRVYNTWQLMDIESPHGELASFYYAQEVSEYFSRSYDKVENENGSPTNYSSKIESHQYQLRKIVHTDGEIVFEQFLADDREDFQGSYALDKISIYDQDLNYVKSFELNQSYQTGVSNGNQNAQLTNLEPTGESSKRLFLDSVVEQGKNGVSKPPYVLNYYKRNMLPHRYSNSQDYWGYYNGADNGQFLTFANYGSFNINRRVNLEKSKYGILDKITYPTGGSTTFTYEHNKGVLGAQHNNVFLPDINPIDGDTNYSAGLNHLMYTGSPFYNASTHNYSRTFTINNYVNTSFTYNIWYQEDTGCSETVITGDCRFKAYLDGNGTTYNLLKGNHTINISPGTYTLRVEPTPIDHDPVNNTDDHFTVEVNWEEQVNDSQLFASGKRIKEVKFYDDDGSLESFKVYEYGPGAILGIQSFNTLQSVPSGPFNILQPLGAVPGSPLSTYQGNTIGYPYVTEYYGNKDTNIGKTEYEYTIQADTGDYASFPYHPPTDNEWLRGLPISIKNYKKEAGNTYSLVKQTVYKYLYGNHFVGNIPRAIPEIFTPKPKRLDIDQDYPIGNTTGLSSDGLPYAYTNTLYRLPLIHLYFPDGNPFNGPLDYKIYHFTGGTMNQFSTTETFYYVNGNTINYSENTYDYANHNQVASTLSQASDDKATITTYTYPQSNIPTPGSPIDDLQTQNRHVPLEVKAYKDEDEDGIADINEALNYLKTTYAWTNGILEPSLVQASKALDENSLEDIIHYHSYNALGKPLEISKTDGLRISYVWGYNDTYPVAKVENATYAEVVATGVNLFVLNNTSSSEVAKKLELNKIRANLPNAMVSTFIYKPMVGITQMTDPKGYTMTYHYDDLNRLKEVRDHNNKLVSENKYHYKNEQ
ncbi:hypothetical protein [uncultured Croceitalea sp.]|uniref:hypothetical protein n=1 Tax=uncultured Croceitalea sp. TaxID=1798908 RepID=UPI00374F494B